MSHLQFWFILSYYLATDCQFLASVRELNAVKVAMSAASCNVSAIPLGVSAAPCIVSALPDSHGKSREA